MLDICLLGTGGMMPLPNRYLTSLFVSCEGTSLLIDCGEGTQMAIAKAGLSIHDIDYICITHFHGDHIGGIAGALLKMANCEKKTPLTIIGPKGLEKIVKALTVIAPGIPFDINYIELENNNETLNLGKFIINASKLKHSTTCYGYSVEINRLPKFNPEKAKELNIPVNYWGTLQHGNNVEINGNLYTPDMVLGTPRKGIKVTYCTDSRPCEAIKELAKDANLLILEAMYGDENKKADAVSKKHMTMQEALGIAKETNPDNLWFTHYSPAFTSPKDFEKFVKKEFPKACIPDDGKKIKLDYKD